MKLRILAAISVWTAFGAEFAPIPAVRAAPAGAALTAGEADYTSLPPLPGCALSAHAVAAALKARGYDVDDQTNLGTGQMDAAIAAFGEKIAAHKDLPSVVYVCGYAAGYNGRPFLLPVSAALARPADVLSQGILAKVLSNTAARAGGGTVLIILDTVTPPTAEGPAPLEVLDQPDLPPGIALLGVTEAAGDAPTPLATTLIPLLKAPTVDIAGVFSAVKDRIGAMRTVRISLSRPVTGPGVLAGAAIAEPPAAIPGPASVPPAPEIKIPEESQMTAADRRTVQAALTRLGYYGGLVDGIFGADTRAAIRRFQHELHGPMTGQLTPDQISRLLVSP